MHKRFRKLPNRAKAYSSSSSNESNVNSNTLFVAKKYAGQKREQTVEVYISETSSDELQKDQLGEENRKWLPSLKKFSSDPKIAKKYARQKREQTVEEYISETSSDELQKDQLGEENRKWLPSLKKFSSDPKIAKKYARQKREQTVEEYISETSSDELQKDKLGEENRKWLPSLKKFSSDPQIAKKYARQKREQPVEVYISETSSDELQKDQLGGENRNWLPNLIKISSDPNPLKMIQHNSYQPLSVSIPAKSSPQAKPPNMFDISNCSTPSSAKFPASCRAAYNSFKQTLSEINRNKKTINTSILDCTPVAKKANVNVQRKKTLVSYYHKKRGNPIDLHISDTSSDELHKIIKYKGYKPLAVSITAKSPSQAKPSNMIDVPNRFTRSSPSPASYRAACNSFKQTLLEINRNKKTINTSILDCTPVAKEANVNVQRKKTLVSYYHKKRGNPIDLHISDTSSDELHKIIKYKGYKPLAVSITAKSPSQAKPSNMIDVPNRFTRSSPSPASFRAACKSFKQTLLEINRNKKTINTSILDCTPVAKEANVNVQRKKTLVSYYHKKRGNPIDLHISDTSSDELHKIIKHKGYKPLAVSITAKSPSQAKPSNMFDASNCSTPSSSISHQDKLEEENRNKLSNLKRYYSEPKPLRLMQHNRYRSLSVSITSQSQPKPTHDVSNCSTESPIVSHSFGETVIPSKPNQETMNKSLLDCTPSTSLETNLGRMVEMQKTSPKHVQKKQRCIKGGYLYEFERLMLTERMDRRSMAQNQRLGISSGQRVQVLRISESFGVKMAQVKPEYGEQDKEKFNIIIPPIMAANIRVGATLELYFDLKPETALKLPNNELVYVHPNKLVLL